jgi:hypothetical protein
MLLTSGVLSLTEELLASSWENTIFNEKNKINTIIIVNKTFFVMIISK